MVLLRDRYVPRLDDLADVPVHVRNEISHFFDIYKELEPGKATDIRGWQDRAAAEWAIAQPTERRATGGSFVALSVSALLVFMAASPCEGAARP